MQLASLVAFFSVFGQTSPPQEMTWQERADQAAQKAESEAIWKGWDIFWDPCDMLLMEEILHQLRLVV